MKPRPRADHEPALIRTFGIRANERVRWSSRASMWSVFTRAGGSILLTAIALVGLRLFAPDSIAGFSVRPMWHTLMWTLVFVAGVHLAIEFLRWRVRGALLTDTRLCTRSGVLKRVIAEVPLARVQQSVIVAPALDRMFGMGTLVIESAGSTVGVVVVDEFPAIERFTRSVRRAAARHGSPTRVWRSDAKPPVVIGIAGGIGSGKSAVAAAFADLGCVVIDSDREAKAALDRPEVRDELVRWWGASVLSPEGRIDRKAVAAIVFAQPAERQRLEALVHPLVRRSRASMIRRAAGARAVIVDAPLLFEAGVDKECDAVVFVDAPREARLARVQSRGWDEAELDRRESAQIPLDVKRAKSTLLIDNAGPPEALRAQVEAALAQLAPKG